MSLSYMEEEKRTQTVLEVGEVKIRLMDETTGDLLGWASCVINGSIFLNNIVIRRNGEGDLILSYPGKRSRSEQKYFYFNPITHAAQIALDRAILGKLDPESHF